MSVEFGQFDKCSSREVLFAKNLQKHSIKLSVQQDAVYFEFKFTFLQLSSQQKACDLYFFKGRLYLYIYIEKARMFRNRYKSS